ncbi:hypothetical protein BH10PSE19_BH10PSE19_03920 [soil metagenome]
MLFQRGKGSLQSIGRDVLTTGNTTNTPGQLWGEAKGREKERLAIAYNLSAQELQVDLIVQATGLPKEIIMQMQN